MSQLLELVNFSDPGPNEQSVDCDFASEVVYLGTDPPKFNSGVDDASMLVSVYEANLARAGWRGQAFM